MKIKKRILCPELLSRIPGQFSWIDRRLVRDATSSTAILARWPFTLCGHRRCRGGTQLLPRPHPGADAEHGACPVAQPAIPRIELAIGAVRN